MKTPAGKIILLNGPSSSGKSSIARALQARLKEPFWHISIDHLRDAGVLPIERIRSGEFAWAGLRAPFFAGFEASLLAYAQAGNNLIVEYIVEGEEWAERLLKLFVGIDLFTIGINCPLEELERRERARADRPIGDARRDFETCYDFLEYNFEVDATRMPEENAASIIAVWQERAG